MCQNVIRLNRLFVGLMEFGWILVLIDSLVCYVLGILVFLGNDDKLYNVNVMID